MPSKITPVLVAAAAALLPVAASAATVVVTTTLDAAPASTYYDGAAFTPFSVELAEGDTFDYTVDFIGDQTLTLTGANGLWFASFANVSSSVTGTGTLSLLDAEGNAFLTSQVKTDTEAEVHFGQYFTSSDFADGLPASLTFYGLHYVGTVDDYTAEGVTSRTYAAPFLLITAGDVAVSGAVPEPATWLMFVAGFGLVGSAVRRRAAIAA